MTQHEHENYCDAIYEIPPKQSSVELLLPFRVISFGIRIGPILKHL